MGAFDGLKVGQKDHGYWGNHTSSIDWCELNYTHTPYIAETINTLSNLPSILLGLYGAYITLAHGVRRRYALCYLGLSLIGVGSTGFHASLRWEWQLMDELPMIYEVSYAAYLVLDTLPSFTPRFGLAGPLIMIAWDVFVTFSYVYLPNPIYHQIAFAFILLTSLSRNIYLVRRLPASHPGRAGVTKTLLRGVVTFASAFIIWNIDNICCASLRQAREYLGPWGFLLEGHAYWHFGTGYGSFLILTAAIYLQLAIKVSPDAYTFDADSWFPVTTPATPAQTKQAQVEAKRKSETEQKAVSKAKS